MPKAKKEAKKLLAQLLYPGPGILENDSEFSDPQMITNAEQFGPNSVVANYPNGSSESFPVSDGTVEPYSAGVVNFTSKGGNHRIRPVQDTDGQWASTYKTALPAQAITNLLQPQDDSDESSNMPYLQDAKETMVAFTADGDDQILGIIYINKFGAYIRQDGSWIGVSPDDDSFDDTIPYYVNPGTADDFVQMYDAGPVTTEEAAQYITSADGSTSASDADSSVGAAPDAPDSISDDSDNSDDQSDDSDGPEEVVVVADDGDDDPDNSDDGSADTSDADSSDGDESDDEDDDSAADTDSSEDVDPMTGEPDDGSDGDTVDDPDSDDDDDEEDE